MADAEDKSNDATEGTSNDKTFEDFVFVEDQCESRNNSRSSNDHSPDGSKGSMSVDTGIVDSSYQQIPAVSQNKSCEETTTPVKCSNTHCKEYAKTCEMKHKEILNQNQRLDLEIKKLTKDATENNSRLESDLNKLQKELDQYQKKNEDQENKLRELEQSKWDEKELQKRITQLEESNKEQVQQISSLEQDKNQLNGQINQHKQDYENAASKIEEMKQSQIEIQKEKGKLSERIKQLSQQGIEQNKMEMQKLEKIKELEESNKKQCSSISSLKQDNNELNGKTKQQKQDYEKAASAIEELKQSQTESHKEKQKLLEKIEHLSEQLSKEWSAKISSDERNIENVSIKNRPMIIADEMQDIISKQWMELKGVMDHQCSQALPSDVHQFLCTAMIVSEKLATKHAVSLMQHIYTHIDTAIKQPLTVPVRRVDGQPEVEDNAMDNGQGNNAQKSPKKSTENKKPVKVPDELKNGLGDYLRLNADHINIEPLVKELRETLMTHDTALMVTIQDDVATGRFLKACCTLAWKMAIQRPPMSFSVKGVGQPYDAQCQEPDYNSDNPKHPKSAVKYYVYPTLMHAQQVMVKGKVFIRAN